MIRSRTKTFGRLFFTSSKTKIRDRNSDKIKATPNSDGLINCLLQPGRFYLSPKSLCEQIHLNLLNFVAPGQILLPRQSQ